ncbi:MULTISPECIES: EscU/YscU/HrcU family type III secretion system export apparatus switch protein [unclassified Halomonas]|uniref:EscU/YscU/HrcU family type III secretion system export apparatus switch protein n=1 Tax=unclassified Halomonas TaxID=2609666 RepID=UPI0021E38D5E|nr:MULTISPECIES: EscU/YscU/HrcU family type III secretion system export apparatus switch protein [unclassified Halomonas]UYG00070.1 EscU/YscU/HrcU family type III secretion system export apparatus switch protein [Halomonas sp. GD1P12]WNL38841.1 EscU/YscU/HrcU family type III secretion system export apparatus switch protein [Halomonas sp. PAMB 3232]WNL42180.1 EscU/YscU/HrcU family type III secretion system export apparatus switch protein [Halomonas sp. PAMB 3264]
MDGSNERRRQAVALAYQEGEQAPRVVAKGYGELAERIMAEAERQGIYVHDAPELVALLMQLNLDSEIPASLYQVVAELLVWVFELSENEPTHIERRK